ncbi:MAG: hypothetical protein ACN4GT_06690 [Gammaproteobacteria bacterium]
MNTFNRKSTWSDKFESVCTTVTFFVICVASPAYGVWSLNDLPVL